MEINNILKKIIPQQIRRILGYIYYGYCIVFIARIRCVFFEKKIIDPKQIPIIINNYNRLGYLQRLISSLTMRGYNNIYIIDNNSSYKPLLDYYNKCPYHIFRLKENVGYLSLWKTEIYKQFKNSYYVYTDSDLEIDKDCPDDFMSKFINVIESRSLCQKVGFGLRIDNLPDYYKYKADVISWESQFWSDQVEEGLYKAQIDTTFALYRPFCKGPANSYKDTYRTGFPYVVHHLPWYQNSAQLSEEDKYYIESISTSTHWSNK